LKKAVIGFFVGIFVFYIFSNSSVNSNDQRQTENNGVVYENQEEQDEQKITEYEQYCASKLKEGAKYEVFGKDLYVKKAIGDETRTYINEKITRGEAVTLKSIPRSKYVQIENKDGISYYESVTTFYENTNKVDDLITKKWLRSLSFDALGHNSMRIYVAYLLLAYACIIAIKKIIDLLDVTRFKKIRENKKISDKGLFMIVPGAMLAAIVSFVRLMSEEKMVYYFMNFNINPFRRPLTMEKMLLLLLIGICAYLFGLIVTECFTTYIFGHAMGRIGLVFFINLLAFYICYALYFVGIAIYALVVIVQCTYYGLELPKVEDKEKAKDKTA